MLDWRNIDWRAVGDRVLIAGISLMSLTCLGYCVTNKDRSRLRQMEIELDYPPEYWISKASEAEANVEITKLKLESKERMELDQRTRDDQRIIDQREFEKNAPAEYWEAKKVREEEKTKREFNRQQMEMNKRQLETNKAIARENAEAIRSSARSVQAMVNRI